MTPDEWQRLFDVFHAARETSGGERLAVLDAACGESTAMRRAVEELLREDEAASGFLSEPLFSSPDRSPRSSPVVAGQRVGRYVVAAIIGRGGMGEVWSARDEDLDRLVALKFLSSETLAGLDPQQITREAKAASALNHPGIVTIYEVIPTGPAPAIAMELVEGRPLREVCGKRLPIPDVVTIALHIAEALAAAHRHGVIHGDIKPENIFLRPDRYVKLLDFGLARKVTTEAIAFGTSPGLGTLRYMSPEQARNEPLTPSSDIFSFGLVLYELSAGRHAFPANSALETAQGILQNEPVPLSSQNARVPARLASLVHSMLLKEPSSRPKAREVVQVLEQLHRPRQALWWRWVAALAFLAVVYFAIWRVKQARTIAPEFRQLTTLVPENRATAAAISPDGKQAAYANVDGIFLRSIADGGTRNLPVPDDYLVDRLAWFADGKKLIASGFSPTTNTPSIWLISADGTAPALIRDNARGATPSPDGTDVAYLNQDWSEVWVAGIHGEQPRKVVAHRDDNTFQFVLWVAGGRRLAFERRYLDLPAYRYQFESADLSTGQLAVISPNLLMSSAASLPGGRVLFLDFDSDLNSSHTLWELKTDPATGALEGQPQKIATFPTANSNTLFGPSVTANGKQAMVLVRSDQNSVFVGNFDQPPPRVSDVRRLTLDQETNYPHAWTADSRAVIFESNRGGGFDLFKQGIDQRTPQVIVATPRTEVLPQLSPDGRFVLYAAGPPTGSEQPWHYSSGDYELLRVPVDGGEPQEVPIGGPLDEFRCALGAGKRCVLRTTVPGDSRTYYDLDPVRGKGVELARVGWSVEFLGDWDISPDGSQLAIPNHDEREAQIRLVSLQPGPNKSIERTLTLPGLTSLRGLVWSASGNGWFVSVDTTVGRRLVYVYPDGKFSPLGDFSGWGVPSPDGKKLAFLNSLNATNAWLLDRR